MCVGVCLIQCKWRRSIDSTCPVGTMQTSQALFLKPDLSFISHFISLSLHLNLVFFSPIWNLLFNVERSFRFLLGHVALGVPVMHQHPHTVTPIPTPHAAFALHHVSKPLPPILHTSMAPQWPWCGDQPWLLNLIPCWSHILVCMCTHTLPRQTLFDLTDCYLFLSMSLLSRQTPFIFRNAGTFVTFGAV